MIKSFFIGLSISYTVSMMLSSFMYGRKHPMWAQLPPWTKFWMIVKAPVGIPLYAFKNALFQHQLIRRVKKNLEKIQPGPLLEVETLEGFRSILRSSPQGVIRVKPKGVFDVFTPIEVPNSALLDLSEAKFVYHDVPVFAFLSPSIVVHGLHIIGENVDHLRPKDDYQLIPVGSPDDDSLDPKAHAVLVATGAATVILGFTVESTTQKEQDA